MGDFMLKEYTAQFKGRKVGFIGCGVSNMPIVELFAAGGVILSVRDKKDNPGNKERLEQLGVKLITGEKYLENIDEAVLFLSPAVRDDIPELVEAKKNGVVLTSETEEFFKLCRTPEVAYKTIAVTGSDGKTTTTTLIAEMLKAAGKRVHVYTSPHLVRFNERIRLAGKGTPRLRRGEPKPAPEANKSRDKNPLDFCITLEGLSRAM